MKKETITEKLLVNGIPFQRSLPEQLMAYLLLLKEWNGRMDLTAVTDDGETIDKHFIDSLIVLKTGLIAEKKTLIDVGTGAGFPGMVLAMARPDLQVTLLDSQQKRLNFLKAVRDAAGIQNISIIHARAEDGARKADLREQFDYAAARALAPLNVLCEYLLPYVRKDGYALCWKGPALKEEMDSGTKASNLLGGTMETPFTYTVSGQKWEHTILPIRKTKPTLSSFPRKAGIPKNKPLGI